MVNSQPIKYQLRQNTDRSHFRYKAYYQAFLQILPHQTKALLYPLSHRLKFYSKPLFPVSQQRNIYPPA